MGAGCSTSNDDDISSDDFGGVDGCGMYVREAGNYEIDLAEFLESHCDVTLKVSSGHKRERDNLKTRDVCCERLPFLLASFYNRGLF